MPIYGNMVGGGAPLKTLILQDEDGKEIQGVVVENMTVFDATTADVKIGKTFVSDEGVGVGTDTKTYRVVFGRRLVSPGQSFSIPIEEYDCYDYTKFCAMIAPFNTDIFDSVAVNKVSLYDSVYDANSTNKISDVTKNIELKAIDLNFTNNTDSIYIINYDLYKEE